MTIIDELVTVLGVDLASGAVQKIKQFNTTLDSVTRTVGWVSAGLVAAATGIAFFAERMNQSSATVERLTRISGINSDTLQSMGSAAEMVGGSFEGMMQDMVSLTKSMSSPIPGEFNHGLFMMGISVRKASGELKSADEVLLTIADRMQGMKAATQAQWASRIGISDDTLLLLQQGRTEIERLQKQAHEIPTIVSAEQLKNARDFTIQLGLVRRVLSYIGQEASAAAGPALKGMVNDFLQFLKQNREFIQIGIKNVIDGIVLGFKRFASMLRSIVSAAQDTFPWVRKLIEGLTDMNVVGSIVFAALAGIAAVLIVLTIKFIAIGAAIMAAALIFEDFVTYLQGGESAIGELIKWVQALWTEFSTTFPGVADLLETVWSFFTKIGNVINGVLLKAFKGFIVAAKELFSVLKAIAHLNDSFLQFLGFGNNDEEEGDAVRNSDRKNSLPNTYRHMSMSQVGNYNQAVLPGAGKPAQQAQPITVAITQNISGTNAPAVASESARKMNTALQQTFPGGSSPVAN